MGKYFSFVAPFNQGWDSGHFRVDTWIEEKLLNKVLPEKSWKRRGSE